jgi:hypothetical protein
MEIKKVKVEDLRIGPIQHESLSPEVQRDLDVVYKQIGKWLGSRETFEVNLMRDANPEREMQVWLRIAFAWNKYHQLYSDAKVLPDEAENRLVGLLIAISTGADNDGAEEWDRLRECYIDPTPPTMA